MDPQTLAYTLGASQKILTANLAGITHDESLLAPGGAPNCMNWLAGHILNSRSRMASLLDAGGPFLLQPEAGYYARGSQAMLPGAPCLPLDKIADSLRESAAIIERKIRLMTSNDLQQEIDSKIFPIKPEKPTLAAITGFLIGHEMYHSGQLGTLRRMIGKASGIGV